MGTQDNMKKVIYLFILCACGSSALANEVLVDTGTEVIIRDAKKGRHPLCFRLFLKNHPVPRDPIYHKRRAYSRPDYRYLDHKLPKGSIEYDGPSNSRKKVYIFAATIATLGVTSAVMIPVTATAAGGSAAGPAVGAIATGLTSAVVTAKIQNPHTSKDYERSSDSYLLETNTDFHRFHIRKER